MKGVGILVSSFIGALVVAVFGDAIVDVAFEDGSAGEELVDLAPLILVALGFYGAWRQWEE